jgi:hypothetical protein
MNLFQRIAKKIARRFRRKGTLAAKMNRPGRNSKPDTAVDLWERTYRFQETPAARAGTNRRIIRERAERKLSA